MDFFFYIAPFFVFFFICPNQETKQKNSSRKKDAKIEIMTHGT